MIEEKFGPELPRFPLALIHPLGPIFRWLPLPLRRHLLYLRAVSRWGNFRHPTRWTEKMQWRILNDRRSILSWTADKLAQKAYAQRSLQQAGMESALKFPEVYWVGNDLRELQKIAHLLPARWALKPNHSSGRFKLFDTTKSSINWDELVALGDLWVKRDEEELVFGHWAYGNARQTLIAEERVGEGTEPEAEIKGWSFDGALHTFTLFHTLSKRNANYDRQYQRILSGHEREVPINELTTFDAIPAAVKDAICSAADLLAEPFDHVRVDFFVEDGQLWFNELSTYSRSGLFRLTREMERARGDRWALPDLHAPDPRAEEWRALLGPLPRGSLQ
jgi:hypothetical protein